MDGSLTILFMADSTMAIMENVKNVVAPNKLVELALYYPKALFNFDFLQISKCINSLFLIMEKHYLRKFMNMLRSRKKIKRCTKNNFMLKSSNFKQKFIHATRAAIGQSTISKIIKCVKAYEMLHMKMQILKKVNTLRKH
ncbi:hypothetical protein JHK85_018479 [Glycine max]|uniref:Uncharacterized protein n=2 Tax=Glycine subgen. Soja TaxID=1462606 RepID=A0A0R0J1E2_SOYBN|nr:hypothetical protein JHK87_017949 [Glycine soja]KAG5022137.1 hypothetical protein JHK85_018479 [Glycine max]KAG5037239.1 hypothetical protein JHK86_018079 [Glycine max]KAH1086162.1 hypothetical protein GYH30_017910 [Glycine max]RZC02216.1 hypothetical protein D0Y65_017388 [Glycine soja]